MDKDKNLRSYKNMSDEDLAVAAQNGETGAQDFLLKKYSASVKKIAGRYFLIGADHEDLVQEGMIGLFKAVRDYSPDRNAAFKSFAELCITRQILTAIKGATRQKHAPLNSYISLDRPVFDDDYDITLKDIIGRSETVNPEDIVINREKFSFIGSRISKFLSKLECKVLLYYLRGESYTDIAERLGKSPKAIDNALQRIRRKFEKISDYDDEL
ncbi:MAG: RNA polymerase sporulation sigma factor SigH [Clostridia bacterium]